MEESHLNKLKDLQKRFNDAIDLLRSHSLIVRNLVKEISVLEPTLKVSTSTISQYRKANIKTLRSLKIPTFEKSIDVFDIHLNDLGYFWNNESKKYEEHDVEKEVKELGNKLPSLIGTWIGYSYNKEKSNGVFVFNSFRLLIENRKVECVTQHGIFVGLLKAVTKDSILIELKNPVRRIYTMGKILSSSDFEKLTIFKCGYLDSGAAHVRCGEVILLRTKDAYDAIKATSYEFDSLPFPSEISDALSIKKFKEILSELKNTQQVVNQLYDI